MSLDVWLGTLFDAGDIIEVRTLSRAGGAPWRSWVTMGEDESKIRDVVLPLAGVQKRDVYVGVCPRTEKRSSAPTAGRVVWADCDGVEPALVKSSIAELNLPAPTMMVNSGNGVHVYWRLDTAYAPSTLQGVTRWLSKSILGADPHVHDPTRIMRVPESINFKRGEKVCEVIEYEEGRVYPLSAFPKMEAQLESFVGAGDPIYKQPLSDVDRDAIAAGWVEGQRHQVALAAAGYLRKTGHDDVETRSILRGIHLASGGEVDDENYRDISMVVKTTFAKPLPLVLGHQGLQRLGIEVGEVTVNIAHRAAAKPKMGLIDFSSELKPQEFWVDGLVGPGLLTMIAAQPKSGKSMIAMQIGHALANGLGVFDFATTSQRRRVLYFQGELSKGMIYSRAKDMFPAGTYENPRQFGMTDKPETVLNLVSDPEPLYDLAEHYDVVIIDPLSVFNANDENSVTSVRETLAVFDKLKAMGKAVILVHHTKKLESNRDGTTVIPSVSDVRGSGAWFAAVDALGILYRVGDLGNVQMKFVFRAAPERDTLTLYKLPHGGFTHDKHTYLRHMGDVPFTIDLTHVGGVN